MEMRPGTADDYPAVASFWNSFVGVEDSIWRYAPEADSDHIQIKIDQGYYLHVAYEDDTLVGFGMWRNEYMLGIAAINKEVYLKIGRAWSRQNAGATGKVRFPNIVCNERTWLEDEVSLNYEPESYKPLKPGEDISTRKVWTYIVTWSLDDLTAAVDSLYGE